MIPRMSSYWTTAVIKRHDGPMKPAKAMTVRLSADQAEELETVALVDNQPISEVIRAAISEHIEDSEVRFGIPRWV